MRECGDLQALLDALRCPECSAKLLAISASFDRDAEAALECRLCGQRFSIRNGIPRMLSSSMRAALSGKTLSSDVDQRQVAAARSFGYEWAHFPDMYREWERNFLEYMSPHTPGFFRGKRVLDAGCGGGRHAHYAAKNGAEVWAVDLGSAVEVAKANNRTIDNVRVAQADLHHLPFEPGSFDLVYSIGVLHHLPDPESAFRNLLRYVKPGGWIHIYLYWRPENQPVKRALLSMVTATRRITTRIPHRLLYGLSFPAAAIAFAGFVWPYQLLLAAGLNGVAERMPMKQYAKYPFRVCVNDQFDRLSAPIEFRYTRDEVEAWMRRAGLEDIVVRPNYGWCATGRKPART
jgi:2-polyprenyl-3-methyl-5-hydroxy-6-metoxy-1,4-benzoquinol methylase